MSGLTAATPVETAQSASRKRRTPAVTVVVSSHNRAEPLAGLLDALEAQDHAAFEVIVADNGSTDDTWSVLAGRCRQTSMRLRALRLDFHDGPAVPRNTCIAQARGDLVAFTDDDCLPTPTWLSALAEAFDEDTAIVQGRTVPEPGGWAGPWGRTLEVSGPTGLYETANLAARRTAILTAGGFRAERLLSGRAFGEDVVLGSVIARSGGFTFAPDAVVHHRVMPATFRDFVRERQRVAGFPLLLREVPELRSKAFLGIFLSKRAAITDLALAGFVALLVLDLAIGYSPWAQLPALAMLPWLIAAWREARSRPGRPRIVRAAQLLCADLAGAAALLAGSVAARRVLL